MLGKLLIFTVLALVIGLAQARPETDVESEDYRFEPSDLCEPHIHHLIPHEYDCTKFYYCEYGFRRTEPTSCAIGTEFSAAHQVCIHPMLANCNLPGTPPTTVSQATTTTTQAATTTTQATTTTPQTTTTTTQATTTTPQATTTTPQTTTTTPQTTTTTTQATTTTPQATTTTTQATTTTTQAATTEESDPCDPPAILPNGCPADFHEHKLLPHETYCFKFYYCVFGEKVERVCANYTYFNYEKQVCDWPRNVNCSLEGFPVDTCEDSDGCNTEENEDDDDPNDNPCNGNDEDSDGGNCGGNGFLPNGCPADFHIHYLLPHETNCSLFYYCVFGEKVERECGIGTHFNPVKQICDWPWAAGCEPQPDDCDDNNEVTTTKKPDDNGPGNPDDNDNNVSTTKKPEDNDNNCNGNDNDNCGGGGFLPNGCPADFDVHFLLPHETNCSLFYYCVHGEKVERECGVGTHFNPVKQICDWPWAAGCEPQPDDCDDNNVVTTTKKPDDNGPGNPDDNDNNVSTTKKPEDNDNNCNGNDNDNCGGGGFLPNGCPADFDVHFLLPHESNCSRFYYCVHGEKVERECGVGTHFNPVKQICDWPWAAGCEPQPDDCDDNNEVTTTKKPDDNGPGNPDDNDNNVSTTKKPEDNDNDCNGNDNDNCGGGGFLPNGCPADFDVHFLLPHESNCSRFYYCVHGEKVERECGDGTHFNPVKQICDWPWAAGCEPQPDDCDDDNEVTTTKKPDDNGPGNPDDNDNNVSTTKKPEDNDNNCNGNDNDNCGGGGFLPNGCPADFDVHFLLPHETNCSRFYYCVHGEKVERECGVGTHFNPVKQICDWPWAAGCEPQPDDCDDNNEVTTTKKPDDNGPGNPDDNDNNVSTTKKPEDNDNNCNGNDNDNCGGGGFLPNGCPADFDVHFLLPHETNCSRFYYCVHGEKVERECGVGTHFNPVKQICDWPWAAGCEPQPDDCDDNNVVTTTQKPDDNGPGNPDDNDNNVSTTKKPEDTDPENPDDNDNNVTTTKKPEDNDVENPEADKCKNECNILPWAHETDCDKFWRCEGESAVLVTCSEGLHFNPKSGTCDFMCNVNCIRDEIQATDEADGIKLFLPWDKADSNLLKLILKGARH